MLRAKCLKALIYKGKPCNHLRLQGFFFGAEGEIWTLARFLDAYSLSRGAPSATWVLPQVGWADMKERKWRREWDSNPRHIAVSLVFKTSSLNRSDISPDFIKYIIQRENCQELWRRGEISAWQTFCHMLEYFGNQVNSFLFIRSDTQEAEGAPLLRE